MEIGLGFVEGAELQMFHDCFRNVNREIVTRANHGHSIATTTRQTASLEVRTPLMEGLWAHGSSDNRFALAGLDHHAWILQLAKKEESLFEDIDFTSTHDVLYHDLTRRQRD